MKISTIKLSTAVIDAAKGAGKLSIYPITEMMNLKLENGKFSLKTTDTSNYITIYTTDVTVSDGENFDVCVDCDLFAKLIGKLTCQDTELVVENNTLTVIGNGKYPLPVVVDDTGVVKFPRMVFDSTSAPTYTVKAGLIHKIYEVNHSSVCDIPKMPTLCTYKLGPDVITTDSKIVCINKVKFSDNEYLVPTQLFELVNLVRGDDTDVTYKYANGKFVFEAPGFIVEGNEQPGIDKFPATRSRDMSTKICELPGECKVSRALLQSITDRLSIFIDDLSTHGLTFTFTQNGLVVDYVETSAHEELPYKELTKFVEHSGMLSVKALKAVVDSIKDEDIVIHFGEGHLIGFGGGDVVWVTALMAGN